ncbi:MAG: hypothetical protein IPH44_17700 [Myxococcales bacterium]|nr:hypothetical protein [Myxococcales bacterium]MBK7196741.1 hypothetical protein [Myxococcales bacterium]
MASITTWVRLEPRARDHDLMPGVEARLHDPLWLLARQWQLGELDGADAGSVVTAHSEAEVARIDAARGGEGEWTALHPDRAPLGSVMGPAPDEASARPPLARRARGGRHLQRLLAAAGLPPGEIAAFVDHYPLALDDAERAALDDPDRRLFAVMAGRVPDGDAAAAALAALLADASAQLPDDLGIAAERIAAASAVCRSWLAWYAELSATSSSPAWRAEQLAYRYQVRAPAAGGDMILAAANDRDGGVRWSDVDAARGDAPPRDAATLEAAALPSRVRFRGMPTRRYWELEDAAVHWPSIDAGPGDVGRLLFVEYGLTFGDHWLMVPLEAPAGAVLRVTSLSVTDTFGVRQSVRAAADLDADRGDSSWRFLELSRDAGLDGPLVFIPPAVTAMSGPVLAAVDFARDDVADVLWAIDRITLGADGRPRTVDIAPPTPASVAIATYRLGPDVDRAFHPYRWREGDGAPSFTLASVPGASAIVRADLPAQLNSHALATAAQRLIERPSLFRTADGGYHVVHLRSSVAVSPPPTPALEFDKVQEPS